MNLIKEKCIILKKIKYGESDLIINALNKDGAKIGLIAKGALKSKKRFVGGVLDPTHYVLLAYRPKKYSMSEGQLYFLEEAQIINDFTGIRSHYDKLQLALYLVDIVYKVSLEAAVDSQECFNLLGNALKALSTAENIGVLKTQFEIKFLFQQGVLPQDLFVEPLLKNPLIHYEKAGAELHRSESIDFDSLRSRTQDVVNHYVESAVL